MNPRDVLIVALGLTACLSGTAWVTFDRLDRRLGAVERSQQAVFRALYALQAPPARASVAPVLQAPPARASVAPVRSR